MMTRLYLLLFVWVAGCASQKQFEPSYAAAEADYGYREAAAGAPAMSMDAEMPAAKLESRGLEASVISPQAPPPPTQVRPKEPQPSDRMVHYDGWARMRVTQPEKALDQVAALATEAGGRVDRLTGTHVTVRVPVGDFESVWAAVLELGDVLDKRVRADDITEQYLAVDLRVRTLKIMQDRLVRLLGRAKSEEEKLALLEQISRVTVELDATESRLRTLKDLASMSTISVEAVPRQLGQNNDGIELDGFEWIRQLSPFNRSVWSSEKRIEVDVPHEMVALSNKGPFMAESADGAVLWTMRLENDPVGDGAFWIAAVEDRIGQEFGDVERATLGDWACLMLQEPGSDTPYRWDVCVRDDGKHLTVAQAYYPSPVQAKRFAERVRYALGGEGGES